MRLIHISEALEREKHPPLQGFSENLIPVGGEDATEPVMY